MPTRFRGKPDQVGALDAFIKLVRASNTVTAQLTQRHVASGLTGSQFGVLETLYHLGPMCQTVLAGKLLTSGGNVTLVVDNLEKRRLVARKRQSRDRRFVTVSLTPAGRKLIEEIFPGHAEATARVFAALSPEEQAELGRLCKKLGVGAAAGPAHGALPAPAK